MAMINACSGGRDPRKGEEEVNLRSFSCRGAEEDPLSLGDPV